MTLSQRRRSAISAVAHPVGCMPPDPDEHPVTSARVQDASEEASAGSCMGSPTSQAARAIENLPRPGYGGIVGSVRSSGLTGGWDAHCWSRATNALTEDWRTRHWPRTPLVIRYEPGKSPAAMYLVM